jgi:hypothetical protein
MAEQTIRVKGLRETQRALGKCEGGLKKEMLLAGKAAAEPVAVSAREKISRYRGASINTIRPRASVRGAFVTQGARKVTGLRGDFGKLQMGLMMDALEEERGHVLEIYELGLYRLTKSAGF